MEVIFWIVSGFCGLYAVWFVWWFVTADSLLPCQIGLWTRIDWVEITILFGF